MKNFYLNKFFTAFLFLTFLTANIYAQENDEITAESDIFDTGKMWTFDYPPTEYLNETYSFAPDDEWFEDVRLSALRIPGCTASFVSDNGLIMTNNHCSTWHRDNVQKEEENLAETGFYAETLEDERNVPGMYAEQLVFLKDVTKDVQAAVSKVDSDTAKVTAFANIKKNLIEKYNKETNLKCQFVSLFNGGRYSIYGYKRFNDVRLVFVPEQAIAAFGGDLDNFTYPRYDLDCAFFRVYDDNGEPVKSKNFFQFSKNGVQKDEVIFSVGNPGTTNRLYTVSQLEYNRDLTYRNRAFQLDEIYSLLEELKSVAPERADEFEAMRTKIGNGQKVYHYILDGLRKPYLIARKKDFENKIKDEVNSNPQLKEKYAHIWDAISKLRKELYPIESKLSAYRFSRFFGSIYFNIAKDIVEYANEMKLPATERSANYQNANIDSLKELIYPDSMDALIENTKLQVELDFIRMNLGDENTLVKLLAKDFNGAEAVNYILTNSILSSREKTMELLNESPEDILTSEDPFIKYILTTQNKIDSLTEKAKEIKGTESVLNSELGKVLYEIYGTEIPPDANFTLRLSDGILKKFNYNGTAAIEKTTFYGMYNRYYGSDKTYPWNLPTRWATPPVGFDLSTPYNFISTNDIVGGNSGSAVINKDAEVVGLAFDGNINSIIGNFIYLSEDNRMVSVASQAIIEALEKVYKAERIVKELKGE
ncbi:MAG: hypothetical protein CR986_03540 [Ignavibacteriae bacterium]|nr:MAG: hypothetical protein CR986_03540 [Ignavibacteriota bacterium]